MDKNFDELFHKAHIAGMAAGIGAAPAPMVVRSHANPLDDSSAVVKEWYVSEGVCGFAWIEIHPGNSPFANFLKKQGLGRKSSQGGVHVWVSGFGQSLDRKEAYARAFAKVVKDAGIKAYANSRMD